MMFPLAGLLPVSALLAQVQAAPAAPNFEFSPVTPGAWSYRPLPGASEALFTDTSGGLRLSVRCYRPTRVVTISRPSSTAASTMFVWTTSAQRSLAARYEPGAIRVSADLHANDRLLDALAFSRGRVAISIPGAHPLVVTSSPEAARVFEDCRN